MTPCACCAWPAGAPAPSNKATRHPPPTDVRALSRMQRPPRSGVSLQAAPTLKGTKNGSHKGHEEHKVEDHKDEGRRSACFAGRPAREATSQETSRSGT